MFGRVDLIKLLCCFGTLVFAMCLGFAAFVFYANSRPIAEPTNKYPLTTAEVSPKKQFISHHYSGRIFNFDASLLTWDSEDKEYGIHSENRWIYTRYVGMLVGYMKIMQDGIYHESGGRPSSLLDYKCSLYNILGIDFTMPLEGLVFNYAFDPDYIQIDSIYGSSGKYGKMYGLWDHKRSRPDIGLYCTYVNEILSYLSEQYIMVYQEDVPTVEGIDSMSPHGNIYIYDFNAKKMVPHIFNEQYEMYFNDAKQCVQIRVK